MNKTLVGYGQDSEKVEIEKVHNACFLVHCEGNAESPFEFTSEKNALEFIKSIKPTNQGETK